MGNLFSKNDDDPSPTVGGATAAACPQVSAVAPPGGDGGNSAESKQEAVNPTAGDAVSAAESDAGSAEQREDKLQPAGDAEDRRHDKKNEIPCVEEAQVKLSGDGATAEPEFKPEPEQPEHVETVENQPVIAASADNSELEQEQQQPPEEPQQQRHDDDTVAVPQKDTSGEDDGGKEKVTGDGAGGKEEEKSGSQEAVVEKPPEPEEEKKEGMTEPVVEAVVNDQALDGRCAEEQSDEKKIDEPTERNVDDAFLPRDVQQVSTTDPPTTVDVVKEDSAADGGDKTDSCNEDGELVAPQPMEDHPTLPDDHIDQLPVETPEAAAAAADESSADVVEQLDAKTKELDIGAAAAVEVDEALQPTVSQEVEVQHQQ